MNRCFAGCLLLGWLLPVTTAIPVQAQKNDIRQLARAVDDHYNHLRSLQSDFTEIYRGDGPERVESGTLWLKKPRKMRWEYRSPKEKLFVSDGAGCVVLLAGGTAAPEDDAQEAGRLAVTSGILAR